MITPGKVNELFHADWVVRDNPLADCMDWKPNFVIDEGFARTITWYRENNYL